MKIEDLKFGKIVVDGKKYHQVIIVGDEIFERDDVKLHEKFNTSHQILEEEKELLFKGEPKIILIADGFNHKFRVPEDLKSETLARGIDLVILGTFEAAAKFNELTRQNKKVNALIHTTC